eukprot:8976553-Ditylum_brightwellii.AAC.1
MILLDVAKTWLMLGSYKNGVDVLKRTMGEEGSGVLFHGIQLRVLWILIGGFVFFGAYESYKNVLMNGFY